MIHCPVFLSVLSQRVVRFDTQGPFGEAGMAIAAVFLVVAAGTGLGIILGLDRVNTDEITAVVFGDIVLLEAVFAKFNVSATTEMAIRAEGLGMAFNAVSTTPAGYCPVFTHPVSILVVFSGPVIVMGQGDALGLVTFITILQRHLGVLFVRHLLCTGLLLVEHQQAVDEQRTDEKNFFHNNPPFLEVVVKGNPTGPVVLEFPDVNIVLHPGIKRDSLVQSVAGSQPVGL